MRTNSGLAAEHQPTEEEALLTDDLQLTASTQRRRRLLWLSLGLALAGVVCYSLQERAGSRARSSNIDSRTIDLQGMAPFVSNKSCRCQWIDNRSSCGWRDVCYQTCYDLNRDSFCIFNDTGFKQWEEQHGRQYSHAERQYRLVNFLENDEFINEHNRKYADWKLGHNQFSDFSTEDFFSKILMENHASKETAAEGANIVQDTTAPRRLSSKCETRKETHQKFQHLEKHWPVSQSCPSDSSAEPLNVDWRDWREHECKVEVTDQGEAATCWAHASIAALEYAVCIAHGKGEKVVLSRQQIVDCALPEYRYPGEDGCSADEGTTFAYAAHHDLVQESSYPYVEGNEEHGQNNNSRKERGYPSIECKHKDTKRPCEKGSEPDCQCPEYKIQQCPAKLKDFCRQDMGLPIGLSRGSVKEIRYVGRNGAELKKAVAKHPVVFEMYLDRNRWREIALHESGTNLIFEMAGEGRWKHDRGVHSMLLVGYGVENGKHFWLAQNSWGSDWGGPMHGFVKLADTDMKHFYPELARNPVYPVVEPVQPSQPDQLQPCSEVTGGNFVQANRVEVTNGNIEVTNGNFVLANGNVEVTNGDIHAPKAAGKAKAAACAAAHTTGVAPTPPPAPTPPLAPDTVPEPGTGADEEGVKAMGLAKL